MSLSKPRIKNPTYELFRYDIRPDVMGAALESELVSIFNAIQDDPNVEWITWAFETVKEYDGTARPFSKHCHVCWKVTKATRADRSGFKVHRFRLKHQLAACAIRFTGRKTWCPSDQWLAGYVQKMVRQVETRLIWLKHGGAMLMSVSDRCIVILRLRRTMF